jgi:hypothetical protein
MTSICVLLNNCDYGKYHQIRDFLEYIKNVKYTLIMQHTKQCNNQHIKATLNGSKYDYTMFFARQKVDCPLIENTNGKSSIIDTQLVPYFEHFSVIPLVNPNEFKGCIFDNNHIFEQYDHLIVIGDTTGHPNCIPILGVSRCTDNVLMSPILKNYFARLCNIKEAPITVTFGFFNNKYYYTLKEIKNSILIHTCCIRNVHVYIFLSLNELSGWNEYNINKNNVVFEYYFKGALFYFKNIHHSSAI